MAGSLQFISVSTTPKFLFRGRPSTGYAINETATNNYEIGHVGDDTTAYTVSQQVQWLKDGLPAVRTHTNTPGTNGRLTSTLSFTFAASDAGVYQCVFTDTSSSEILVTVPTLLDTGEYTVASKLRCLVVVYTKYIACYTPAISQSNGVGTGGLVAGDCPLPIFQSAMLKIANIFQML